MAHLNEQDPVGTASTEGDEFQAEVLELVRESQFSSEKALHLNRLLHHIRVDKQKEGLLSDPFILAVVLSRSLNARAVGMQNDMSDILERIRSAGRTSDDQHSQNQGKQKPSQTDSSASSLLKGASRSIQGINAENLHLLLEMAMASFLRSPETFISDAKLARRRGDYKVQVVKAITAVLGGDSYGSAPGPSVTSASIRYDLECAREIARLIPVEGHQRHAVVTAALVNYLPEGTLDVDPSTLHQVAKEGYATAVSKTEEEGDGDVNIDSNVDSEPTNGLADSQYMDSSRASITRSWYYPIFLMQRKAVQLLCGMDASNVIDEPFGDNDEQVSESSSRSTKDPNSRMCSIIIAWVEQLQRYCDRAGMWTIPYSAVMVQATLFDWAGQQEAARRYPYTTLLAIRAQILNFFEKMCSSNFQLTWRSPKAMLFISVALSTFSTASSDSKQSSTASLRAGLVWSQWIRLAVSQALMTCATCVPIEPADVDQSLLSSGNAGDGSDEAHGEGSDESPQFDSTPFQARKIFHSSLESFKAQYSVDMTTASNARKAELEGVDSEIQESTTSNEVSFSPLMNFVGNTGRDMSAGTSMLPLVCVRIAITEKIMASVAFNEASSSEVALQCAHGSHIAAALANLDASFCSANEILSDEDVAACRARSQSQDTSAYKSSEVEEDGTQPDTAKLSALLHTFCCRDSIPASRLRDWMLSTFGQFDLGHTEGMYQSPLEEDEGVGKLLPGRQLLLLQKHVELLSWTVLTVDSMSCSMLSAAIGVGSRSLPTACKLLSDFSKWKQSGGKPTPVPTPPAHHTPVSKAGPSRVSVAWYLGISEQTIPGITPKAGSVNASGKDFGDWSDDDGANSDSASYCSEFDITSCLARSTHSKASSNLFTDQQSKAEVVQAVAALLAFEKQADGHWVMNVPLPGGFSDAKVRVTFAQLSTAISRMLSPCAQQAAIRVFWLGSRLMSLFNLDNDSKDSSVNLNPLSAASAREALRKMCLPESKVDYFAQSLIICTSLRRQWVRHAMAILVPVLVASSDPVDVEIPSGFDGPSFKLEEKANDRYMEWVDILGFHAAHFLSRHRGRIGSDKTEATQTYATLLPLIKQTSKLIENVDTGMGRACCRIAWWLSVLPDCLAVQVTSELPTSLHPLSTWSPTLLACNDVSIRSAVRRLQQSDGQEMDTNVAASLLSALDPAILLVILLLERAGSQLTVGKATKLNLNSDDGETSIHLASDLPKWLNEHLPFAISSPPLAKQAAAFLAYACRCRPAWLCAIRSSQTEQKKLTGLMSAVKRVQGQQRRKLARKSLLRSSGFWVSERNLLLSVQGSLGIRKATDDGGSVAIGSSLDSKGSRGSIFRLSEGFGVSHVDLMQVETLSVRVYVQAYARCSNAGQGLVWQAIDDPKLLHAHPPLSVITLLLQSPRTDGTRAAEVRRMVKFRSALRLLSTRGSRLDANGLKSDKQPSQPLSPRSNSQFRRATNVPLSLEQKALENDMPRVSLTLWPGEVITLRADEAARILSHKKGLVRWNNSGKAKIFPLKMDSNSLSGAGSKKAGDGISITLAIKKRPEFPGISDAILMLSERLFGRQCPQSFSGRLHISAWQQKVDGRVVADGLSRSERVYPVSAAEFIQGPTLLEVLEKRGTSLGLLNPKAFTQLILLSLISGPGDMKPDDLVLEVSASSGNKYTHKFPASSVAPADPTGMSSSGLQYRLIWVDTDRAFMPSWVYEGTGASQMLPGVRCCLWYLDEMRSLLDIDAVEEFLHLDVGEVLHAWIADTGFRSSLRKLMLDPDTQVTSGEGLSKGKGFSRWLRSSRSSSKTAVSRDLHLADAFAVYDRAKALQQVLKSIYHPQSNSIDPLEQRPESPSPSDENKRGGIHNQGKDVESLLPHYLQNTDRWPGLSTDANHFHTQFFSPDRETQTEAANTPVAADDEDSQVQHITHEELVARLEPLLWSTYYEPSWAEDESLGAIVDQAKSTAKALNEVADEVSDLAQEGQADKPGDFAPPPVGPLNRWLSSPIAKHYNKVGHCRLQSPWAVEDPLLMAAGRVKLTSSGPALHSDLQGLLRVGPRLGHSSVSATLHDWSQTIGATVITKEEMASSLALGAMRSVKFSASSSPPPSQLTGLISVSHIPQELAKGYEQIRSAPLTISHLEADAMGAPTSLPRAATLASHDISRSALFPFDIASAQGGSSLAFDCQGVAVVSGTAATRRSACSTPISSIVDCHRAVMMCMAQDIAFHVLQQLFLQESTKAHKDFSTAIVTDMFRYRSFLTSELQRNVLFEGWNKEQLPGLLSMSPLAAAHQLSLAGLGTVALNLIVRTPSRLHGVVRLNLVKTGINDSHLRSLSNHCVHLIELKISNNKSLVEAGTQQRLHFPSLQVFDASQCSNLKSIVLDCPMLRTLRAQKCGSLSVLSVMAPLLSTVSLSGCVVLDGPAATDAANRALRVSAMQLMALLFCGHVPVEDAAERAVESLSSELAKSRNVPKGTSALGIAVMASLHSLVEALIRKGSVNLNGADIDGVCPVHHACVNGDCEVLRQLLDAGADPQVRDSEGITPLHCAAINDHPNCISILLAHDVPIDPQDKHLRTPLHLCALYNISSAARRLIGAKANTEVTDADGLKPIHVAIARKSLECLASLIEGGADINSVAGAEQFAPAHVMVEQNQLAMVKLTVKMRPVRSLLLKNHMQLLKEREQANQMDNPVTSDADSAVLNNNEMQSSPDTGAVMDSQASSLQTISEQEEVSSSGIISQFIIDAVDSEGRSPLVIATQASKLDIAAELLHASADPTIKARNGHSSISTAVFQNDIKAVRVILAAYARPRFMYTTNQGTQISKINDSFVALDPEDPDIRSRLSDEEFQRVYSLVNMQHGNLGHKSCMHIAAENGFSAMVEELLYWGASLTVQNISLHTPLHRAVVGLYLETMTVLLKDGAHLDMSTPGKTFGFKKDRDIKIEPVGVKVVDAQDATGWSPLMHAVDLNSLEAVELLLNYGASAVVQDHTGKTPLAHAVERSYTRIFQHLLGRGVPVDMVDGRGRSPLHIAVVSNDTFVMGCLLDRGADPNATDFEGLTPLHLASSEGKLEACQLLLERFDSAIDINQQSSDGSAPLHLAVNSRIVELLSSRKDINFELADAQGLTPVLRLCFDGKSTSARRLLLCGANVSAITPNGECILHIAAASQDASTAKTALELGVDVDVRTLSRANRPQRVTLTGGDYDVWMDDLPLPTPPEGAESPRPATAKKFGMKSPRPGTPGAASKGRLSRPGSAANIGSPTGRRRTPSGRLSARAAPESSFDLGLTTPMNADGIPDESWNEDHAGKPREDGAELLYEDMIGSRVREDPQDWADSGERTALAVAARHNSAEVAKVLLEFGGAASDVNDDSGSTPVHICCFYDHRHTLEVMLANGAQADALGANQETSLHLCAIRDSRECAKILLHHGSSVSAKDVLGCTPLSVAAYHKSPATVAVLVGAYSPLNAQSVNGHTALHMAAASNCLGSAKVLVAAGSDMEVKDDEGRTALFWACRFGNADVSSHLVSKGADSCNTANSGHSPFSVGCVWDHPRCVRAVLASAKLWFKDREEERSEMAKKKRFKPVAQKPLGAVKPGADIVTSVEPPPPPGPASFAHPALENQTALHMAATLDLVEVCRVLIDGGCRFLVKNSKAQTPLHLAVNYDRLAAARLLIGRKPSQEQLDNIGHTPLQSAVYQGRQRLIRLLYKAGGDINRLTDNGQRLVHLACAANQVPSLSTLHNLGEKLDQAAEDGAESSPLHVAAFSDAVDCIHYLVLDGGVKLSSLDKFGTSPMQVASMQGKVGALKALRQLEKDVSREPTAAANNSKLRTSLRPALLLHLSSKGKSAQQPAAPDATAQGAFFKACYYGHDGVVLELIGQDDVDPDLLNPQGQTGLHIAARNGHASTVGLLLTHGADPTIYNSQGKCPFHIAAIEGYIECVQMFLTAEEPEGEWAKKLSVSRLDRTVARCPTATSRASVVDSSGLNALHQVAAKGLHDIASLLVTKYPALAKSTDFKDRIPLHYADMRGHVEIQSLLASYSRLPTPPKEA